MHVLVPAAEGPTGGRRPGATEVDPAATTTRSIGLQVRRLPHSEGLPLPGYATDGAAGLDLVAALVEPVTLAPGGRLLIPTGLCVAIPAGYEGQVRPRSGLALKRGIGMVNSPGTIDSDYRGEVGVILVNWSSDPQTIYRGDRIAQLVIAPVAHAEVDEVADLDETDRGIGGFGSTGTNEAREAVLTSE